MSIQQLNQSMLGYKKCCLTDKNYDSASSAVCAEELNRMIFPSSPKSTITTNSELFSLQLLQCDLFSVLVALLFYHSQECPMEEFDNLVQILFAALLVQIVLKENTSLESTAIAPTGSIHPNVADLLQLVVNAVSSATIDEYIPIVQQKSKEFLRKVYILRHTLYNVFFSSLPEDNGSINDICEVLIRNPQQTPQLPELLTYWIISKDSSTEKIVRSNSDFCPFSFIDLPQTYSFTYDKKYTTYQCPNCGKPPLKPALCLICGTILCSDNLCCSVGSFGECNTHLRQCGNLGVFLLLCSTMILLLKDGKGCLWGSIYVDEHGEIDKDLSRGKELHISSVKLQELKNICEKQLIPKVCQKKQAKSRSIILWDRF